VMHGSTNIKGRVYSTEMAVAEFAYCLWSGK
jgi:hypothetical protein